MCCFAEEISFFSFNECTIMSGKLRLKGVCSVKYRVDTFLFLMIYDASHCFANFCPVIATIALIDIKLIVYRDT